MADMSGHEPTGSTEHPTASDLPAVDHAEPPEPTSPAEELTPAPPEQAASGADQEEPLITPGMNWFVLRVASNKEDYVRETLLQKIRIEGLAHLVNRILVPTEKQKTVKNGKPKVIEKKLYPGYVFVEMRLEDDGRIPQDVFFLIKETTGVGDFIGTAGRPSPMTIPEIEKMLAASKPAEEAPTVKMEFQKGESVRITEGPFENTEAVVDELLPAQGKVQVTVHILSREVTVELEHWKLEKIEEE
jgi:transcriptional antiterminator NusG